MCPMIRRRACHGEQYGPADRVFSCPCLARFFFILATVGRSVVNIGFIERPLVLGFFYALCTGHFLPTMPLAVFFELFWIDLFPLGSFLPPFPAFPFLLLLTILAIFNPLPMQVLFVLILAALPLAHAGAGIERVVRERNASLFPHSSQEFNGLSWHSIARLTMRTVLAGLLVFLVAVSAYLPLALFLEGQWGQREAIPGPEGWAVLLLCATPGGILALRRKEVLRFFVIVTVVAGMGWYCAFLG